MSNSGKKHIGFISTRFAGNDGVSLETTKWADVFEREGFHCYYFAGKLEDYHYPQQNIEEALAELPEVAG